LRIAREIIDLAINRQDWRGYGIVLMKIHPVNSPFKMTSVGYKFVNGSTFFSTFVPILFCFKLSPHQAHYGLANTVLAQKQMVLSEASSAVGRLLGWHIPGLKVE
jgi:hypothetical protein